jgi:hypothetical protein
VTELVAYNLSVPEGLNAELGLLFATLQDSTQEWKSYMVAPEEPE